MKIVEVFRANGTNIICVDRTLSWSERARKTAKVKNLTLAVAATTNNRWMSTKDEIHSPQSLVGEEIELM